jgi:MoaA/NifB/PqqE/SkfB family radical SAM enzyme
MGNAVYHDEILLQPYELATLMPLLAELHAKGRERELTLLPGNNIGYFGPHEVLWRGPDRGYYSGCPAGQNVIGLEADGTLKGCPSLATERYGAGDVRTTPIAEMWANHPALEFNRNRGTSDLWGSARPAITSRLAAAAAPGHRTRCSAAAATIPIVITAC